MATSCRIEQYTMYMCIMALALRNKIQLFQIILVDVYHRHGDITLDSKTQYHRHDASGEDSNKHCTVGFGLPEIDNNRHCAISGR